MTNKYQNPNLLMTKTRNAGLNNENFKLGFICVLIFVFCDLKK